MADEVKVTPISDAEVAEVSGGAGTWRDYAKGTYVRVGDHIEYTVASGDVLSGIAPRFGVSVEEIARWNNIKDVNFIRAGQKLVIYARILR